MKFYLLDDPATPHEYAMFSPVGTWTEGWVCDVCGVPMSRRIEPLQIEWEDGADRIGHFSWRSYICVVVDTVRAFMERKAFEANFARVEVARPTGKARRPRVPFPYRGPRLSWLVATLRVPVDEARCGVRLKSDCPKCKQRRYSFKRDGLVVSGASWSGEKIFHIKQFDPSAATFITEEALAMLQLEGFSNLCPRYAGVIDT